MLGISLSLVLFAAVAPSTETSVSWQAPASECPDATTVRARIEGLLGRELAEGEVRVEGVVEPSDAGFSLRLRVWAGDVVDERRLSAEDCDALGETAALVAAVMIDPEVAVQLLGSVPEPDEPEPEPEPTPTPEPESDEPEPEEPEEPEELVATTPEERGEAAPTEPLPAPSRQGLWLRARGGGELGAVPGGTGGIEVAVVAGGPRVRAELTGAYWIGRPASSADATARIHLGHAAARACGVVPPRRLAAVLCGGLELGAMRADATSPAPLTRNRVWLAAQAEAALRWQASRRVALWVGLQPFVPLVFPRFELDEAQPDSVQTIHVPFAVGARGLVGIEVRAWPRRFEWGG